MKKLFILALLSIVGLSSHLYAMDPAQVKLTLKDGEVLLGAKEYEEFIGVLPEDTQKLIRIHGLPISNVVSLLSKNDFQLIIDILPRLSNKDERFFWVHFRSLLVDGKYEEYRQLLVIADYLGIDFLRDLGLKIIKDERFPLEHFWSLLDGKKYEKYGQLLVIADYLGIDSIRDLGLKIIKDQFFPWIKENNSAALEAFLNFQKKYPHLRFVEVDIKDQYGTTALILATKLGKKEIVKMLLEAGASVDLKTKYLGKATAFMWASKLGHPEIMEMLLGAGASVTIQDEDGKTALMWATAYGKPEDFPKVFEILQKAGVSVDHQDLDGNTALMLASRDNKEKIVGILLNAGADRNIRNKKEQRALDVAQNKQIKQLLQ